MDGSVRTVGALDEGAWKRALVDTRALLLSLKGLALMAVVPVASGYTAIRLEAAPVRALIIGLVGVLAAVGLVFAASLLLALIRQRDEARAQLFAGAPSKDVLGLAGIQLHRTELLASPTIYEAISKARQEVVLVGVNFARHFSQGDFNAALDQFLELPNAVLHFYFVHPDSPAVRDRALRDWRDAHKRREQRVQQRRAQIENRIEMTRARFEEMPTAEGKVFMSYHREDPIVWGLKAIDVNQSDGGVIFASGYPSDGRQGHPPLIEARPIPIRDVQYARTTAGSPYVALATVLAGIRANARQFYPEV